MICPQCCKQYASQNSLYSHLNRVHGVKKDMLQDMQLQMVQQQQNSAQTQVGGHWAMDWKSNRPRSKKFFEMILISDLE